LWSNDEQLLSELGLAAGHLTAADLSSMEGDPLVKRRKKEDGSTSWSGIKERLHESQCGPEFLARLCGFLLGAPSFFWIRAYHDKFGVHLAQLKKEMGKPSWKVGICVFSAAWFP
jgi:hypothetical protein